MMTVDFSAYYQPKPKQLLAHGNRAKYLLYGGAMGSGKSWFLCAEAVRNAMQFPGNRLVIVRKNLSVVKQTTLVTFFRVCPPALIRDFNRSSLTIDFINGSQLIFLAADNSKDPLLDKLKGLEIGWAGLDEANEIPKAAYDILKSRLRWVLPNGKTPRYEIRLTSNPENCWLLQTFVQSTKPEEVYIPALTTDNYDPSSEYYQTLKEAFKDSPSLLNRYLNGDWSLVDAINSLFPAHALERCRASLENGFGTSIGVDVARYGDDRTVFVVMVDGNIEHIETHQLTSIPETATRTMALIDQYRINPAFCGVDSVGLGAGVCDILKGNGYHITEINGGEKPDESTMENETLVPANLKAQIYFDLRKTILDGGLGCLTDEALRHELALITYEIAAEKKVRITPKSALKRLHSKSPDMADALAYAHWVRLYRGLPCLPISGGA